jgi:alpha-L-fucosidase 2
MARCWIPAFIFISSPANTASKLKNVFFCEIDPFNNMNKTSTYLALIAIIFAGCTQVPTKVACIGDSITAGAGLENQSKAAYPSQLDSILGENYTVLNCGRSAATLQRSGDLPYWVCKEFYNVFAFQPDIILIKLGTNDTKPKNWNEANFEKDYQAFIDTLRTIPGNPEIIVCLPVPAYQIAWGINDSTLTVGVIPAIRRIAKTNHLQVIDLYQPMSYQHENFPDGIHPNEVGARNMAVLVAKEMEKYYTVNKN